MNKAEQVLRTYIDFEDANGSEPITLLPLTVIDAMEEYATQCQEDMADKKYTEEDVINIVNKSRETGLTAEYLILSLNKQDNEK